MFLLIDNTFQTVVTMAAVCITEWAAIMGSIIIEWAGETPK